MPTPTDPSDQILLAPLLDVLFSRSETVTLEIVTPPFPCAGIGSLRVVRFTNDAGELSLVAAYEGYAPL